MRLPVHVSERLGQLNRTAQRLRQELEREPTAPELAETLHLSVAQVHAMQARTAPMLSLDTPIADGQGQLGDLIAERTVRNPLDTAIETELSDHVRSCMQALTPREAYIVRARFGLDTGEGQTLEEIGQALQLSRERVRQTRGPRHGEAATCVLPSPAAQRSRTLSGWTRTPPRLSC